jgi:hypothetical protein
MQKQSKEIHIISVYGINPFSQDIIRAQEICDKKEKLIEFATDLRRDMYKRLEARINELKLN